MTEPFSFDTIKDFDDHISKSIPGYEDMFRAVVSMAKYFVRDGTNVYDLGCSTGRLLGALSGTSAKLIGIDKSKNLLPTCKQSIATFLEADLNEPFVFVNSSLVVSLFTLQFLEKRVRADVVRRAWEGLNKGGALILAEKVYSRSPMTQDIFTFLYYDFKGESFSSDEILAKERDLRSLLLPLTERENVELLEAAGFRCWDVFWRRFNFEALVAVK